MTMPTFNIPGENNCPLLPLPAGAHGHAESAVVYHEN